MTTEATEQLRVEDIHKSFLSNEVLKGISLTANRGDVISVVGSSGSGKSTFLRCINFLETPDAGQIAVRGEELQTRYDKHRNCLVPTNRTQLQRMRTRLGMVFQHFNLWSHMTVLKNVTAAPVNVLGRERKTAESEAKAYLNHVGLPADVYNKYPIQLSGGQQQRVAIARALALEPEVLLFDEPTSALDPELVGEVLKTMRDLAEAGRTMIVVTHEMTFARNVSNHIIFLHQGLIEEEGDPQKVLDSPSSPRLTQFLSSILE